jgi:hypothetical protein
MSKSPFPTGFLSADLFYDGAWQALGTDLDQQGVHVSHGARSEGSSAEASGLAFRVTNPTGKYSPRNPLSPLFGKVGRNTPARARVALGAPWLDLETAGARATTPDVAALDIVGDIDIRWHGYRDSWGVAADLMSKWSTTGNQRSWLLRAELSGLLTLFWSVDGTAVLTANGTVPIPPSAGEIALRVTVDVNNGAGGRTITFYWSDSVTGTWTQLGDPVVQAGTTSIFSSTAALTLGKEPTSVAGTPPQRVHAWQLHNGIGGTVVSSRTTSALTAGSTSFADDQARTWTVTSGSVTNLHTLAVCEVAEWPVSWNRKGPESVMVDVRANGVTRRISQGAEAVDSVLYRAQAAATAGLLAYWPLEDGTEATEFGPAFGSRVMNMSTGVDPAAYDAFRGSAPLPIFDGGRARGRVGAYTGTGEVQVRWVMWLPPAGVGGVVTLLRVELTGGTISWVDVKLNAAGDIGVYGYDDDGNEIAGSSNVVDSQEGKAGRVSLELSQNGAKVNWHRSTLESGASTGLAYGQDFTPNATLGRVSGITVNPYLHALPGVAVGHVAVGNVITSLYDGVQGQILTGFTGERASARMNRLALESGTVDVSVRASGAAAVPVASPAAMGEQQERTLLELLAEAEAADGGILHDDQNGLGLRYRSLASMATQIPVTIPYTDNLVIPFEPSDDDRLTRNRVTVQRPNGTRMTYEVETGPMGSQPPSAGGVGLYDEALTLNVETDDIADRSASWRAHVGTHDEGRYPSLGVDLAHPSLLANPVLTRKLLDLTPGDRVVITNPPAWLPPTSVDVLVMGVDVQVTPDHLRLVWACVPARPYRMGFWNAGHRYSGEGTVVTSSKTTTATSWTLTVPYGVVWTHADGDYQIMVGGELMTVTNVVGTVMTVVRSVNGVVKTHAAGAAIVLADPSFYAR